MLISKKNIIILVLLGFTSLVIAAQSDIKSFMQAVSLYQDQKYQQSALEFESLASKNIVNGDLYYNLGNAYLKNENLGRAILWYERALRLTPNNPSLRFNLEYARSLTTDKAEYKAWPLLNVIFFWQNIFSSRTIQLSCLTFNAILWISFGLNFIWRQRLSRITGRISLILLITILPTAIYQLSLPFFSHAAIILPEQVSVYSGRTEKATKLFNLHSGAKVLLQNQKDGFAKIKFGENKVGWLPVKDIGII